MLRRFAAGFFIFIMIFTAACAGGNSPSASDASAGDGSLSNAADSAADAETTADLSDSLPAKDYGGAPITLLVQSGNLKYFYVEQLTGEIIDDDVYNRNIKVEERFGVKLSYIDMAGGWDDRGGFMNAIRNAVKAGDGAYDIVAPEYYYGEELVLEGMYLNLLGLDALDFSRPWWTQGYNGQAELFGKLYAAVGGFSLSQLNNISILFFNKRLAENYNTGDLYSLVRDGKWTFERLYQTASAAGADLNGDGAYTADDQFGHLLQLHGARTFTTNFMIPYIEKDADGIPQIVFFSEKTVKVFDMIYDYFNKCDFTLYCASEPDMTLIFKEGRALYMTYFLGAVSGLRDMDIDFGLLPMPKYDEAQSGYRTTPVGTDLFSIPVTVTDAERASVMLEALNAETYRSVTPDYYDIALKTKSSRDEESGEMLDIIVRGLHYDFGFINGSNLSYLADYFGNNIVNKVPDYASYWAKNEAQYQRDLDKLIEFYRALA